MAPRGIKRQASEAGVEVAPAKRLNDLLKKNGVKKSDFNSMNEVIDSPLAEGLTEDCKGMLKAILPQSLLVPANKRHALQTAAVEMLGGVVTNIKKVLQENIEVEAKKLTDIESTREGLDSKAKEAEEVVAAKAAVADEKKKTLAEAAKAVLGAKADLAAKVEEQATGNADLQRNTAEKDSLQSCLMQNFGQLRDGTCQDDQDLVKQHHDKVQAVMEGLSLDESLVTAVPGSLTKKPEERGSFDTMVVAQLGDVLAAKLSEVAAAVEAATPAAEQRAAAVAAAQGSLDAAKDVQQEAAEALSAAQADCKEAEAELATHKKSLADYEPSHQAAKDAHDAAVAKADAFRDEHASCYERLVDRVHPAPPAAAQPEGEAARLLEDAAMTAVEAGA